MSKHQVDEITDLAGTGAPDFPNGIKQSGLKHVKAYLSSGQTGLSSNTTPQVNFDATKFNSFGSEFDVGTGRFTASEAGFYSIQATALITSGTTGEMARVVGHIYKNGVSEIRGFEFRDADTSDTDFNTLGGTISTVLYLNSSDYIDMRVYGLTHSGTWDINGGSTVSQFSITKIG